jgi:hypothetical protein
VVAVTIHRKVRVQFVVPLFTSCKILLKIVRAVIDIVQMCILDNNKCAAKVVIAIQNQLCINLGAGVGTGRNKCRPSLVLSFVSPTNSQKMSSKSANILFDDMFTLQDVDRARFERGAFSISSTFNV